MGVNLVIPRRTPGSPGTTGLRSAPRRRVLFINMYKYKGKVQKCTKVPEKDPKWFHIFLRSS